MIPTPPILAVSGFDDQGKAEAPGHLRLKATGCPANAKRAKVFQQTYVEGNEGYTAVEITEVDVKNGVAVYGGGPFDPIPQSFSMAMMTDTYAKNGTFIIGTAFASGLPTPVPATT